MDHWGPEDRGLGQGSYRRRARRCQRNLRVRPQLTVGVARTRRKEEEEQEQGQGRLPIILVGSVRCSREEQGAELQSLGCSLLV